MHSPVADTFQPTHLTEMTKEEYSEYSKRIFSIRSEKEFNEAAIYAFRIQYENCPVYREYADLIGTNAEAVDHFTKIPFLPIGLFKKRIVETENGIGFGEGAEKIFSSSATTGMHSSSHIVKDISLYEKSFLKGFEYFYGSPSGYVFLGLLPSYLEREGSSLVYMVDRLMRESSDPDNGYYLYDYGNLYSKLEKLSGSGKKVILFGVTFALVEMAEKMPDIPFGDLIIMETGGMKGRGKEVDRKEFHDRLKKKFSVKSVHSEYGMAELLSQAYSYGDGIFMSPPWMKVSAKDIRDPFKPAASGTEGRLDIIDLANINSCCFIETEDRGETFEKYPSGLSEACCLNKKTCHVPSEVPSEAMTCFTVNGRILNSEIRGCNMLL